MKYYNAKTILPQHLLTLLQQYAEGACLYIPSSQNNHVQKQVVSLSECKLLQLKRNEQIKHDYETGTSVSELAKRHYLSKQAIYKIIKF